MAAVNKIIIVFFLLSATSIGCAGEIEKNGKEMVQLAYKKMIHAISEANKRVGSCMEKEKKTILPSHIFPKLPLSKNEWKSTIAYLSIKAQARCEGNALARALMAFSQFKFLEKKITGKNAPDIFPAGTYQYELEDLCCGSLETEMRAEIRYKKIDPKTRQTLENIPELNQPFNVIAAAKALGL